MERRGDARGRNVFAMVEYLQGIPHVKAWRLTRKPWPKDQGSSQEQSLNSTPASIKFHSSEEIY